MRLFQGILIGVLSACVSVLAAQDTTVVFYKSADKFKIVPESRAGAKMVQIYDASVLIERRLVSLPSKKLRLREYYEGKKPIGIWQYWDEKGRLFQERDFAKLIYKSVNLNPDSAKAELEAFLNAGGVLAKFGAGESDLMSYLRRSIEYPKETKRDQREGIVYITFVVDEKGIAIPSYIHNEGFDGYCDLIVWEMIENMPRWTPAVENGEDAEMEFTLPVQFNLR